MTLVERRLRAVHAALRSCRKCHDVCGRAVFGPALDTPVPLVGQAPGVHEESRGKPFAHTAGRTLCRRLVEATGADEHTLREVIYVSAVLRCFPGKNLHGAGDRAPGPTQLNNCRPFLAAEVRALRPKRRHPRRDERRGQGRDSFFPDLDPAARQEPARGLRSEVVPARARDATVDAGDLGRRARRLNRHHQDVDLYIARPKPGESVKIPGRPGRGFWVQVTRGEFTLGDAELNEHALGAGDGAAIEREDLALTAITAGEALVFDLA